MLCQCTKMYFKTLASGSKGNCAIVLCGNTKLIIDAGISYTSLKRKLEEDQLSFADFSGILVTHCHNDHTKGLKTILKNTKLKALIPEDMYQELKEFIPNNRYVFIKEKNKLNETIIELIRTSHDTESSVGYLITYNNKSLVYITDTGYINRKYLKKLTGKNIYLIESNHDEEMLMNGPYPPFLKQRVLSDRGHLSNKTTAGYLKGLVSNDTEYILLAHISEKNNTSELAYKETTKVIKNKKVKIMVAEQNESSPLIEV